MRSLWQTRRIVSALPQGQRQLGTLSRFGGVLLWPRGGSLAMDEITPMTLVVPADDPAITPGEPEVLFTPRQAAVFLNVSVRSVWRFVERGHLTPRRVG